jgi:RsiW-degrading membrane proteinase PrsW (M82 family)
MGASTWQVGTAPVELTNLLGSLGARLNKLTSTEKLEGFSLATMFSEVFKARKPGEIEDYFVVGTTKTTPPLDEVQTGWPKPWFFMRVLLFMLGVYFLMAKGQDIFGNILQFPGIMMIGSLAVPLGTAMLFWELNTPRNVSFVQVLTMICLGGVISLFFADIAYQISNLGFLGTPSAGIVEEVSKLLAVVIVVRNTKYKYILNGMVFGAAIGAGFAFFETAGYSFREGYLIGVAANAMDHVDTIAKVGQEFGRTHDVGLVHQLAYYLAGKLAGQLTFQQIDMRSFLAPFGHVVWTAIAAGALWRVKGADPLRLSMFFEPTFMRMFLVPVVLHMLWDTDLIQQRSYLVQHGLLLGLGAIGYWFALLLVQQGLRQIKDAQVSHAKSEYSQTQEILTTTGRFRAGVR